MHFKHTIWLSEIWILSPCYCIFSFFPLHSFPTPLFSFVSISTILVTYLVLIRTFKFSLILHWQKFPFPSLVSIDASRYQSPHDAFLTPPNPHSETTQTESINPSIYGSVSLYYGPQAKLNTTQSTDIFAEVARLVRPTGVCHPIYRIRLANRPLLHLQ